MAGAVAFAAPFREGPLVATRDAVEAYSLALALDELGELPVQRASAIAVAPDGTAWVLDGHRRLRSFAADGALLSDTRLPSSEDDDDDDEQEDDDESGEHVALAVLSGEGEGVAVALDRDLFLLSAAGDVTAEFLLPHEAVAADVYSSRLWVAHEKGLTGFEGGVPVANISVGSKTVKDFSVAANG